MTTLALPDGMQINAPIQPGFETILTPEALAFVAKLHRAFEPLEPPRGQHHLGAGLGQGLREVQAQTTAGPGHERALAVESKVRPAAHAVASEATRGRGLTTATACGATAGCARSLDCAGSVAAL